MRGRPPSAAIVVDANILIGLVLGVRGRAVWELVSSRRRLMMSAEAVGEVMAVVGDPRHQAPNASKRAAAIIELVDVSAASHYGDAVPYAKGALRNAVASRNGSERDAHILALAWAHEADIWSHDRDFGGTGWPSWSSANLAGALADEGSLAASAST